jgi:hypothetical protein
MSRRGPVLVVLSLVVGSSLASGTAEAQWFSNLKKVYHRNAMWPEPFLQPDREATMTPFAIQVANGWRRQNLLSDYHFSDHNHQLTQAGEVKLRYILTQMPPMRRTVFVQQGLSPEVTESRLVAVQRAATRIAPPGQVADVVESNLPNDGWPAEDIDAVTRKFNATRPDPRLSPGGISGGDGGSGGYDNSSIK